VSDHAAEHPEEGDDQRAHTARILARRLWLGAATLYAAFVFFPIQYPIGRVLIVLGGSGCSVAPCTCGGSGGGFA